MTKGTLFPPEARTFRDEVTGATIRQVTTHPAIHHHPFYYLPAYDDAMARLVFISHRTGQPTIFAELRDTGQLLQLTEREDLAEWSVHPSHDGRYVYFVAGNGAWRVDCLSLHEKELAHFGAITMREAGMVGAAMGTTTLSHDDRYWAVPVKVGECSRFVIIDTATGAHDVILERDTVGHPEFHPSDNSLLRYAGPFDERIWVINRDGTGNRLVYKRDQTKKEWIVHETWRPGPAGTPREIVTTHWPHGVIGIDIDSGAVRQVCTFNAWHPSINRQGTRMCADTTFPDRGLMLFDPLDGIGEPHLLCLSHSSNAGAHWNTDHCPYDDGPVQVYAPQHTHPHPAFAPDSSRIVFTSDRSGHAQLYEVEIANIDKPKGNREHKRKTFVLSV
jgi:oligogalacturonide lyase